MKKEICLEFSIYRRMRLQVIRDNGVWLIYRVRDGRRTPYFDIAIPPDMAPEHIHRFLDDMFHEGAGPGDRIERILDGS